MKKGIIIAAAAIVLALIVYFSVRGNTPTGENVYAEPVKVRAIDAIVTAPGEIQPKYKVNISAYVIGKIEHLYFQEGDRVRKGQKLVELERQTYVAQADRMNAELSNRRIEVTRARTAMATAEMTYGRALKMQQQGIQAQELYDKARLDFENAKAVYASAGQSVAEAAAGLNQAETDLAHTTILSPIDGKVVQLSAHEGEVVITGTMNNAGSVIAVIADLSEILVEAEVGETEVVGIHLGQPAGVHVDAVADKEYRGHVSDIGSSAAVRQSAGSGLRYFKVKVSIDDPDERLRPGMTSQVSITTSSSRSSVSVPIQCVVERTAAEASGKTSSGDADNDAPKQKYVAVIRDGKAHMVPVQTGISNATHVAITSGLKNGDSVVTGPIKTLKTLHEGDAVQVTKEEKVTTTS